MIRLFAALRLPNNIVDKIIEFRKEASENNQNIKWEKKEKLHLTLKFIGDVSEDLVDRIKDSLLFIEDFKSIELSLTKFGFFFRDNHPNILWLGLSNNNELNILVDKIETNLEIFGFKKEKRKFNPHLTLLRIKNKVDKNFINSFENYKLPSLKFYSNEITLFKSELLPDTSRYIEIKNYKLKDLEEK